MGFDNITVGLFQNCLSVVCFSRSCGNCRFLKPFQVSNFLEAPNLITVALLTTKECDHNKMFLNFSKFSQYLAIACCESKYQQILKEQKNRDRKSCKVEVVFRVHRCSEDWRRSPVPQGGKSDFYHSAIIELNSVKYKTGFCRGESMSAERPHQNAGL